MPRTSFGSAGHGASTTARTSLAKCVAAMGSLAILAGMMGACTKSSDEAAATSAPAASSAAPATSSAVVTPAASETPPEKLPAVIPNPAHPQSATELLGTLTVAEPSATDKADPAKFGPDAAEANEDACNVYTDVLRRDLVNVGVQPGTSGCGIAYGTLVDSYTGNMVDYARPEAGTKTVVVDRIVSLDNAWASGANQFTDEQRAAFASDPRNMQAASADQAKEKAGRSAAEWVPANKNFTCQYVARQIGVKATYGLTVTQAEHDAFAQYLQTCPNQLVPGWEGPAGK